MLSPNSNDWHCLLCQVKANHKNFPFTPCDDIEIQNINNSNSLRFCESLSRFEVVSEVSKFSNITCNEVDYNLPVRTTCKYYSANEFLNLKTSNNLNIFHTNINGQESKFDILHEFISNASVELDIVAITGNFT